MNRESFNYQTLKHFCNNPEQPVTMAIDRYNNTETKTSISKKNSETTLTLIPVLQNSYDIKHTTDAIRNPSSSTTAGTTFTLTYVSNLTIHLLPKNQMKVTI